MSDNGLFALGLPCDADGRGGTYREIARAAHHLTMVGGVPGVSISWLCHIMNGRLHLARQGSDAQCRQWLPRLAAGDSTICIAISEPGIGAHPKYLATRAVRDGDDFIIDGEKTYLTNGPLADLFIVLAVTDEQNGRKAFSAFLVPLATPGVERTSGVSVDFLHPSPHCGLKLVACRVSAANILGQANAGLAEISLPMRAIEDALNTSVLMGCVDAQLNAVATTWNGADESELASFGGLLAKAAALRLQVIKLADELDTDDTAPGRLNGASSGFRGWLSTFQNELDAFVAAQAVVLSPEMKTLRRDLVKMLGIADTAHRIHATKRATAYIGSGGHEGTDI